MIVTCIQDYHLTGSRSIKQGERYFVIDTKNNAYFVELGNFSHGWFPALCFKTHEIDDEAGNDILKEYDKALNGITIRIKQEDLNAIQSLFNQLVETSSFISFPNCPTDTLDLNRTICRLIENYNRTIAIQSDVKILIDKIIEYNK